MFASPTKRLKVAARPFIRALAASTASRRRLELIPAPRSIPSLALSAASSKSRQTSVKLLTARLSGGDSRCPSSRAPVARLRESLQEQNCWVAELFLELCPLDPNATPVLLDAFSLADLNREPASKKPGSSFDPKTCCQDSLEGTLASLACLHVVASSSLVRCGGVVDGWACCSAAALLFTFSRSSQTRVMAREQESRRCAVSCFCIL